MSHYRNRIANHLKKMLRDPIWQGIGGVAAIIAIVVAIVQVSQSSTVQRATSPTTELSTPTSIPGSLETVTAVQAVTPSSSSTPDMTNPEAVANAFYQALENASLPDGSFDQVVQFFSEYSLEMANMDRRAVQAEYENSKFMGQQFLDHLIVSIKRLDDQTTLIQATLVSTATSSEKTTVTGWMALRKEEGQWRINLENVIDDRILNVPSQTINGVTIQPTKIVRYTDKLRLYLVVENTNQRSVFWGVNGIDSSNAIFYIGNEAVNAVAYYVLEPNREYTNGYYDHERLYLKYPTAVKLTNWYWADSTLPNQPDVLRGRWKDEDSFFFELR